MAHHYLTAYRAAAAAAAQAYPRFEMWGTGRAVEGRKGVESGEWEGGSPFPLGRSLAVWCIMVHFTHSASLFTIVGRQ